MGSSWALVPTASTSWRRAMRQLEVPRKEDPSPSIIACTHQSCHRKPSFIQEMFTDLGLAMLVAIALVYVVLVLFFGSIAQPITILAPILFSTIGSLLALIVTGRALGLPAMIGQLLLIGIVVANSILIVDTALRLRRSGMARNAALEEAARLRVRPVLMTAVATIAALLPLA